MSESSFVLVSAVRNEAEYIDGAIDSIAAQTARPLRWVIIDDNSDDETYSLASRRANGLPFVEVIRANTGRRRDFASKVYAIREALCHLATIEFSFVGFLDADIRFGADYYEKILNRFNQSQDLGIAGGIVLDIGQQFYKNPRLRAVAHHVAGGVQLFRRRCYKEIGGYAPLVFGGEDTVAEVKAVMAGWGVRDI